MRKSELSKWGLNELCCKRTVHRWNRLELNFPSMYGTGTSHSTQKLSFQGVLSGTVLEFPTVSMESPFPCAVAVLGGSAAGERTRLPASG